MKEPYREILTQTNVADKIVESMEKANRTGVEHGFTILRKGCCGLYMTPIIEGDENTITLPLSEDTIATLHTHPTERFESLFSIKDVNAMIQSDVKFSVAIFDEGDRAVADVFDATKDVELKQYERPPLQYVEELNKELHLDKIELGELVTED